MGFVLDLQNQVNVNDGLHGEADSTIVSAVSLSVCLLSTVSLAVCI